MFFREKTSHIFCCICFLMPFASPNWDGQWQNFALRLKEELPKLGKLSLVTSMQPEQHKPKTNTKNTPQFLTWSTAVLLAGLAVRFFCKTPHIIFWAEDSSPETVLSAILRDLTLRLRCLLWTSYEKLPTLRCSHLFIVPIDRNPWHVGGKAKMLFSLHIVPKFACRQPHKKRLVCNDAVQGGKRSQVHVSLVSMI